MRLVFLLAVLVAAAASTAGAAPRAIAHDCAAAAEVRFSAADGTKLVGHTFGKGPKAVILAHQSEGDLCDWAPYARRLASRGYFVLPIDFRGYGLSQARTGAAATRFPSDLAAAVKKVRQLGKKKVFLVGSSMGGGASLVAATSVKPALTGVVSVSAPARFRGMDALGTAKRLRVPVLYLAAEQDVNAGFDFAQDAETMHAAATSSDKRLEVLPGSLHGIALMAGSARARAAVESFLRTH